MTEHYLDDQLKRSYSELVDEAHANPFLKNYLLFLEKEMQELKDKLEEK